jgi:hypothetical protein
MHACMQGQLPAQQVEYWPGRPSWLQLQHSEDSTLVFESRFESGNLRRAVQVGQIGQRGGAVPMASAVQ